MPFECSRIPSLSRHLFRIPRRIEQICDELLADALNRIHVETRLVNGQGEKLNSLVPIRGKRFEIPIESVAAVLIAHAHGYRLHALLERAGVQVSRTLVQHRSQEVGKPLLAGRVLSIPAFERELERHQRIRMILHQPSLNSAGTFEGFDLHGVSGPGKCNN